jgi:dTMP kinase
MAVLFQRRIGASQREAEEQEEAERKAEIERLEKEEEERKRKKAQGGDDNASDTSSSDSDSDDENKSKDGDDESKGSDSDAGAEDDDDRDSDGSDGEDTPAARKRRKAKARKARAAALAALAATPKNRLAAMAVKRTATLSQLKLDEDDEEAKRRKEEEEDDQLDHYGRPLPRAASSAPLGQRLRLLRERSSSSLASTSSSSSIGADQVEVQGAEDGQGSRPPSGGSSGQPWIDGKDGGASLMKSGIVDVAIVSAEASAASASDSLPSSSVLNMQLQPPKEKDKKPAKGGKSGTLSPPVASRSNSGTASRILSRVASAQVSPRTGALSPHQAHFRKAGQGMQQSDLANFSALMAAKTGGDGSGVTSPHAAEDKKKDAKGGRKRRRRLRKKRRIHHHHHHLHTHLPPRKEETEMPPVPKIIETTVRFMFSPPHLHVARCTNCTDLCITSVFAFDRAWSRRWSAS